ncbi:DUF2231 domain-containing protein [Phenylobacterium sp.]|uniref:DUF2231 domain-containing protein n=1 Tax=Phenylobacterium sp. TaxID=1871053 RepID=UPI0028125D51|nr:DUF2231 domain-containing protein [Phenylobacterium sp.]
MRDDLDRYPRSRASIAGHPLHPMVIPFPITLFVAAFATDVGFLVTGREGWAAASVWMLGAGLAMAALAAVLGLIDFMGDRAVRGMRPAWLHMLANVMAVLLEAVNLYMRTTQGATEAVAPAGIILSGVVVLLLVYSGWMGGELVYKRRVGVAEP